MTWWFTKVRRFVRYFVGRVSAAERDQVRASLSQPQMELFESMHRADQRHGLDVVAALRADGQANPDLLLAGLLHDCGKGRQLHVSHRVGWSLAERYGPRVERLALRLRGFKPAFAVIAAHAERSAQLALDAGCSPASADLIRHQSEPVDEVLGRALLIADQAN